MIIEDEEGEEGEIDVGVAEGEGTAPEGAAKIMLLDVKTAFVGPMGVAGEEGTLLGRMLLWIWRLRCGEVRVDVGKRRRGAFASIWSSRCVGMSMSGASESRCMGECEERKERRRRCDLRSNVTRAFSDVQERFCEEKRESTACTLRGMLKLVWAAERRRGIPVPRVAFLNVLWPGSVTSLLVHAMSGPVSHLEPVYPFAQTQRQVLAASTLVLPWEQECELLQA